jgi:hypothetical protein
VRRAYVAGTEYQTLRNAERASKWSWKSLSVASQSVPALREGDSLERDKPMLSVSNASSRNSCVSNKWAKVIFPKCDVPTNVGNELEYHAGTGLLFSIQSQ